MAKFCNATRTNGEKCRTFAMRGQETCYFHTNPANFITAAKSNPISASEEIAYLENEVRNCKRRSRLGVERAKILLAMLERLDKVKAAQAPPPVVEGTELSWEQRQERIKAEARAKKS